MYAESSFELDGLNQLGLSAASGLRTPEEEQCTLACALPGLK